METRISKRTTKGKPPIRFKSVNIYRKIRKVKQVASERYEDVHGQEWMNATKEEIESLKDANKTTNSPNFVALQPSGFVATGTRQFGKVHKSLQKRNNRKKKNLKSRTEISWCNKELFFSVFERIFLQKKRYTKQFND